MQFTVVFAPEAAEQLAALSRYIAAAASTEIAERFTHTIVTFCEGLQTFPHRGNQRDDIRPGLRVTNYKERVVVAFAVNSDQVAILGIFYGGQNYEAVLQSEFDDSKGQEPEDET